METRKEAFALFALAGLLLTHHTGPLHAQQAPKTQTKHCLWKVEGRTNVGGWDDEEKPKDSPDGAKPDGDPSPP